MTPCRPAGFTSVLALGAVLCFTTTNIATGGKFTQNQHETNPNGFVRLAWAALHREEKKKGKASRKWMRACERVILDALKNPSPFIRECLRQSCSGLALVPLEPAVQAGQEPHSLLPVLLCLLPCQP